MSGFDFLRRLRRHRPGRGIPVIVWTDRDIAAEERQRLAATVEDVVLKSAGAGSLVEELRQCVPIRRRPA
jgi:CheY-like chemotaxis protein